MADTTGKIQGNAPQNPGRRAALRRLGGAVLAAYVVPEVVFLSEARAESSGSVASGNSPASGGSSPSASPPSPPEPSTPSPSGGGGAEGSNPSASGPTPSEACNISGPSGADTLSISRSDLIRSQEAIEAGYARPLEQIWADFTSRYDGKIIGIEFTGRRRKPRYRFRAISSTGRLETVTISARTGEIIRIVGC